MRSNLHASRGNDEKAKADVDRLAVLLKVAADGLAAKLVA